MAGGGCTSNPMPDRPKIGKMGTRQQRKTSRRTEDIYEQPSGPTVALQESTAAAYKNDIHRCV